jgi:hypothetical protein
VHDDNNIRWSEKRERRRERERNNANTNENTERDCTYKTYLL